jgi:hypothetical protein
MNVYTAKSYQFLLIHQSILNRWHTGPNLTELLGSLTDTVLSVLSITHLPGRFVNQCANLSRHAQHGGSSRWRTSLADLRYGDPSRWRTFALAALRYGGPSRWRAVTGVSTAWHRPTWLRLFIASLTPPTFGRHFSTVGPVDPSFHPRRPRISCRCSASLEQSPVNCS